MRATTLPHHNNKAADSPHSSLEEHSMTPPETSISSTISSAVRTTATTPNGGNFREFSPSLIVSHAIMKEDYASGSSTTTAAAAIGVGVGNECAYRANFEAFGGNGSSSSGGLHSSKDLSLVSKYNQESYRIYSHQLHHHHHYHYALQSPTQSTSSSGSANYPYQSYPSAMAGDTDVDPKEMEQYLDSSKYRKFCYYKPEATLTELAPMNGTIAAAANENYCQSVSPAVGGKSDAENVAATPVNEVIIASNQPANAMTYGGNYQETLPPAAPYQYMSNWVNYSI